jgi:hypothetical protein
MKEVQKKRKELLWESVFAMNLKIEERVREEQIVGICINQKVRTYERLWCSEYWFFHFSLLSLPEGICTKFDGRDFVFEKIVHNN